MAAPKNNGKSGCGAVIKGVDRDKWVTLSRIAVPLTVGTTMAALWVCVLAEILDLVFNKSPSVQNFNRCIDTFLKSQRCGIFSELGCSRTKG